MGYGKLSKGVSQEEAARKLEKVMPVSKKAKDFKGTTPPSVFVGSHNYPKVNTGILSPQHPGSTEYLDSPKDWYSEDFSIRRIASLRTSLVNSKTSMKVSETDSFVTTTQEIAMARKPVDIEVSLEKAPSQVTAGRVKPVSASGDVKDFILEENPTVEKKIEDAFYDRDWKAENAVKELHSKGIDNYSLQKALTAGILGEEDKRELVPTRWSITATDDMLSKSLRERVKDYQELGKITYFKNEFIGNEFHIFLIPGRWEYELAELKRTGSVWNSSSSTFIKSNYEGYSGRTSYADETAGAYYATRLGVLEYLDSIQRQAKVLVVRDVKPDYWAPLGVWVIREAVRNAFGGGEQLETVRQVKSKISRNFTILYPKIRNEVKMMGSRQSNLQNF